MLLSRTSEPITNALKLICSLSTLIFKGVLPIKYAIIMSVTMAIGIVRGSFSPANIETETKWSRRKSKVGDLSGDCPEPNNVPVGVGDGELGHPLHGDRGVLRDVDEDDDVGGERGLQELGIDGVSCSLLRFSL